MKNSTLKILVILTCWANALKWFPYNNIKIKFVFILFSSFSSLYFYKSNSEIMKMNNRNVPGVLIGQHGKYLLYNNIKRKVYWFRDFIDSKSNTIVKTRIIQCQDCAGWYSSGIWGTDLKIFFFLPFHLIQKTYGFWIHLFDISLIMFQQIVLKIVTSEKAELRKGWILRS